MNALAAIVRDLVLLRRGPQDMPHSPAMLGALIVAAIAFYALVASFVAQVGVPRATFSLLVTIASAWIALAVANRRERFVQTATALVTVDLAFSLLALPLLVLQGDITPETKQLSAVQGLAVWMMFAVFFWHIAVVAHVFRHALELPFRVGLLVAVAMVTSDLVLGAALFERATP